MSDKNSGLNHWRETGGFIQTSKGRLFVRQAGTGETLLLIHGFPTSSWDWHALLPFLQPHFEVLMIDMLGYGYSDKPSDHHYSTASQVKLIEEVLAQKGINAVHIMTYSMERV